MGAWCVLDRWMFSQPHEDNYDEMMRFADAFHCSDWPIARSSSVPTGFLAGGACRLASVQPHALLISPC
jgi:hypothetical protein